MGSCQSMPCSSLLPDLFTYMLIFPGPEHRERGGATISGMAVIHLCGACNFVCCCYFVPMTQLCGCARMRTCE